MDWSVAATTSLNSRAMASRSEADSAFEGWVLEEGLV